MTILSDSGNVYDVIFMASRAALWDTKVPKTRSIQYAARQGTRVSEQVMDTENSVEESSGFDTRHLAKATDFELIDTWDEGEPLDGRERWPICLTLNIVSLLQSEST